ncbi:MAG: dihydroneopterin aldolase [Rhodospirillales bacterium]|nr:dihydroneopterin aldolase [Rhodospirillales bacterium]
MSSNIPSWTEIFIDNLALDMFIGVHDHEKAAPQRVLVSLSARVDPPHADRDDLSGVVSYGDLVRTIQALAEAGHINLLETFAERIAEAALGDSRVHAVSVRIAKPQACTAAQGVGVQIFRARNPG